jgi:pyruvate,water dikinase
VGEAESARLTAALVRCETMTTRVNAELRALAALARRDAALTDALCRTPSRALWERHDDAPFWRALRDFLTEHGHRETDFDAYHPTWAEAPWVVLDQVRALLDAAEASPAAPPRALSALSRAELEALVLARTPEGLRPIAATVIRLAREYTALDDLEHYHTTRLSRPMRRGVRAIGTRLVERGLLTDPMDVFFARRASLARAVAEDTVATWASLAREIADARAVYERARQSSPRWALDAETEAIGPVTDALTGIAGSPGVAEGVVHVVRGVEDFADFPRGAVLVARTTNPAWTSLFYSAAAVVTESGGPLSHGAVTAREMHIPAVMAVRGALSQLRTGDRVWVDGGAGRVVVVASGSVSPE